MTERTPDLRDAGPGERRPRLAEPPSARYAEPTAARPDDGAASALRWPLAKAALAALLGAAALVEIGAVSASTVGLLFVSGAMGAAIGLLLARAAVPGESARPIRRTAVTRLAVVMGVAAVALADVGTWLFARGEGGTLGLVDYLLTTFGPFVPAEALLAAVTAWWGAGAGPVQR